MSITPVCRTPRPRHYLRRALLVILLQATVLTGCATTFLCDPEYSPKSGTTTGNSTGQSNSSASALLLDISTRYQSLVDKNDDFLVSESGVPASSFPDRSLNGIQNVAQQAQQLLQELKQIPLIDLQHQDQLTVALLERDLKLMVEAPKHYWVFFDLTPYNGGYVMSAELPRALKTIELANKHGVNHYLTLLADVGRFVSEMANKLRGQRQRNILLPKAAIPRIRNIYSGLRENMVKTTHVDDSRIKDLSTTQSQRLKREITKVLKEFVYPAMDLLNKELGDDYLKQAPVATGLSQYPGGEDYYQYLIRRETSLALTPDQIHELGLKLMSRIQKDMQSIRNQLEFTGSAASFHQLLSEDQSFYASSPAEVEARYRHYIDRVKPHLLTYFSRLPKAPYGVTRLNPVAEAGMTHGYYRSGDTPDMPGRYFYNGSNLDTRSMISAGSLIYHELMPGHHFQISLARENEQLTEYRRNVRMNAFAEGWANYASGLTEEMGLLDDPYDRYGWLLSDAFLAARLVVDTGLNHKGWSVEQASRYLMDNTLTPEEQVATEILRYSTDIHAQALSYKLGHIKILELREKARNALGEHFDLRAFHDAVLTNGTVTLPVLEQHIQWYINEELNMTDKDRGQCP